MDKITQITKYRTTDGVEHSTRAAAEDHQFVVDLTCEMNKDLDFRDCHGARDVAAWLATRYTLTPKK
jgi:hypothetical protein